jgi:hypothetical protein
VGRSLWSIHIEQEEGEKEEVRAVNEPVATHFKNSGSSLKWTKWQKKIQVVDQLIRQATFLV